MAGTVKLEKLGRPGVFINCDTFEDDAKSAAEDNGMPALRRRMIKSSEFYKVRGEVSTIRPLVQAVFPGIVEALVAPLTPEELDTRQTEKEGPPEITYQAVSFPQALEDFNQDFLQRQWGDGLPLVPPTAERLHWMLAGTNRRRGEILGKINPKQGLATVEKVAINAVMAGARPEYLPVIIAAIQALAHPDFDDLHVLASAGSFTLLIVVSGPIGKEIKMNSAIGFLGHGWRANNTIGRSVRLATLNIGQIWPAKNDMALTGRISPHTFYTFAENNEASAWEPYHVRHGFKASDSCVTVASIYGTSPISNFYGGMIGTWTANGILDRMVEDLIRSNRRGLPMWGSKGVGPLRGSGGGAQIHMIILFPELVSELKKMGYDQKKLQEHIYNRVTIPYEELRPEEIRGIREALDTGVIPETQKPVFETAMKPGGRVPVLVEPESLHFFVAGGAPGCAFSFSYMRTPPYNKTAIMTVPITDATLTRSGMATVK